MSNIFGGQRKASFASTEPHMRFNDHRAVCAKCFTYCVMNAGAPLCTEGTRLQKEWKTQFDEEGKQFRAAPRQPVQ